MAVLSDTNASLMNFYGTWIRNIGL